MKSSTKKAYPFEIFDFLLSDTEQYREAIDNALSRKEISGYIPAFFYRHSLFTPSPVLIDYYGGYTFSFNPTPGAMPDIILLDRVLSGAAYKDGYLFFEGSETEFEELCNKIEWLTSIRIAIGRNGSSTTFNLFDRYLLSGGKIKIVFSQILKVLYAFDYTLDYARYAELHRVLMEHDIRSGNGFGYQIIPVLRNILSRTAKTERDISIQENVFKKAGILSSLPGTTELKVLRPDKKSDIGSALIEAGLTYNEEACTLLMNDKYQLLSKPGTSIDRIDTIDKGDRGSITEPGADEPEGLCFLDLELSSEFVKIAEMNGVSGTNIPELFETFKRTYQELQDKRGPKVKYKDASRCFKSYLAKNRRYTKIPNVGLAENITYDIRMDEITRSFGFEHKDIEEIFKSFKLYHTDKGNEKKSWYPSWRTWLENNRSSSSYRQTDLGTGQKEKIEEMANVLSNKIMLVYRSVISGKGVHRAELEAVAQKYEERLDGFKDRVKKENLFSEDEVAVIKKVRLHEMLRVYADEDTRSLRTMIEKAFVS